MVPLPEMIANFAVTYKCNSRCKTCSIWKYESNQRELAINEIRDFLTSNKELFRKIKTIQITGGEPYLRDDLDQVVKVIEEKLPVKTIWIATNGLLPDKIREITEQILQNLSKTRLGVTISLDGSKLEHDNQRGINGSFEKALQTLEGLSELSKQFSEFSLSVGMTLTPSNQHSIEHVKVIADMYKASFSLRPINTSDFYYRNKAIREDFDKETLRSSLRFIGEYYVKSKGFLRSLTNLRYLEGVERYARGTRIRQICSAASNSFFMDPYGTIYPCIVMNEPLGNIRKETFSELWASRKAWNTRGRIQSGLCPGCWVECETFRDIAKDKIGLVTTACRMLFIKYLNISQFFL